MNSEGIFTLCSVAYLLALLHRLTVKPSCQLVHVLFLQESVRCTRCLVLQCAFVVGNQLISNDINIPYVNFIIQVGFFGFCRSQSFEIDMKNAYYHLKLMKEFFPFVKK